MYSLANMRLDYSKNTLTNEGQSVIYLFPDAKEAKFLVVKGPGLELNGVFGGRLPFGLRDSLEDKQVNSSMAEAPRRVQAHGAEWESLPAGFRGRGRFHTI